MAVKFNQVIKEGVHTFVPHTPMAFEDARAEEYFKKAGWAEDTDEEPVMTWPEGTVTHTGEDGEVHNGPHPDTVSADTGRRVLED